MDARRGRRTPLMPTAFSDLDRVAENVDVTAHLSVFRSTGSREAAHALIETIVRVYRQRASRTRILRLGSAAAVRKRAMASQIVARADCAAALATYRFTASGHAARTLTEAVLRAYRAEARRPDGQSPMARQGNAHGRVRLSIKQVRAIRTWADPYLAKGLPPPWVSKAREIGVSEGAVRDVALRRTWTHVS